MTPFPEIGFIDTPKSPSDYLEDALGAVSHHFYIHPLFLMSKVRKLSVARPRQIVMWLTWEMGNKHKQIGDFLNRDRTTVIHGIDKIDELRAHDEVFDAELGKLLAKVEGDES